MQKLKTKNQKNKMKENLRSKFSSLLLTNHYSLPTNCGFTLIEIVVALGIIIVIFVFGVKPFIVMRNNKILDESVVKIEALLQEASSMTISSVGASRYGVHFEETKAVLFVGDYYIESDSNNKDLILNKLTAISEINLNNNRPEIIFDRLTGKTSDSGNIKISLVNDSSKFKTITISSEGVFSSN